MTKTIDYKAKVLACVKILACDDAGELYPDKQWTSDEIGDIYQELRNTFEIRGRGKHMYIEQSQAKTVNVAVYVAGGVLQGADADSPDVSIEVFDVDDKRADGMSCEAIDEEWKKFKKVHPHELILWR